MARVVVDSNVLIAARFARDRNHERAADISQALDCGDLPTAYVPDCVLEEVVNYLLTRADHDTAVRTLDALLESSGFEVVHTTKGDFDAGRSLFRKYEPLSLTDSIIAASMQRQEIDYLYSFDSGFDAISTVTRLTTPENPFS